MRTPAGLLREFAGNPLGLAAYAAQLQQQLAEKDQALTRAEQELAFKGQSLVQTREELAQTQEQLSLKAQQLAEAQAIIAELKRELFGAKADKLSEEQEGQLRQVLADTQEQAQRPPPLSREVLEEALAHERIEQRQRAKERTRRHLPPVELEKQQVILEPEDKLCPTSGQERPCIGQEVTTEYDYVPAKLIIRELVRRKYGQCEKPCCQGVAIAPLPPRLVPQSKLGLGLAVYLLLSRFDDHVAYYTLERIFRERFGVIITRQQMVQWVEKVAHWLQAIDWLIWEELKAGDYLQIDESPVKVLDPEVKGKAAQGYLWFYSKPGGYVFLGFIKVEAGMDRANDCVVFAAPCRPMATSFTTRCARSTPPGSGALDAPVTPGASSIKPCWSRARKPCGSSARCANSIVWNENSRTPVPKSGARAGSRRPRPSGWR